MNYPMDRKLCPVCGEPTWQAGEETFDPDWKQQVDRLKNARERRSSGLIPNAELSPDKMVAYKDRLFVADPTMQEWGYNLEGGEVVQINGEFYDVVGAMFPETEEKGWWIEAIPPFEWPKHLTVMSDFDYTELDKARGLRV